MSNGWLSTTNYACSSQSNNNRRTNKRVPFSDISQNITFPVSTSDLSKLKQTTMLQFYNDETKRRKRKKVRHSLHNSNSLSFPVTNQLNAFSSPLISRSKISRDKENVMSPQAKKRLNLKYREKESTGKSNECDYISSIMLPSHRDNKLKLFGETFSHELNNHSKTIPLSTKESLYNQEVSPINKHGSCSSVDQIDLSISTNEPIISDKVAETETACPDDSLKLEISQFVKQDEPEEDNIFLSQPVLTGSKNNFNCSNDNSKESFPFDGTFKRSPPSPLFFTEQMTNFNYNVLNDAYSIDGDDIQQASPLIFTEAFTDCRQEDFYENSQAVLF